MLLFRVFPNDPPVSATRNEEGNTVSRRPKALRVGTMLLAYVWVICSENICRTALNEFIRKLAG